MAAQWLRWLALLGLGLAFPAAAAAHGGSAKIERVAALDDDGAPWLLQLSDGLALRQPDGWRFVCPAAFEASSVLQALSVDGQTAWVSTARGVFRLASDGTFGRRTGMCGDSPSELVAHRGAVYALARDSRRNEFVVCELAETGPREVYASALSVDDFISDGEQLWLARTTGDGLELDPIGEGEPRTYQTVAHRAVRLAFAGGSLYASLIAFGRTTLIRLLPERIEILFETTSPLYGPVESQGRAVAGTQGRLIAFDGPQLWPVDTSLLVENVDGLGGYGFAFAGGALYEMPISASPTGARCSRSTTSFHLSYRRRTRAPNNGYCSRSIVTVRITRHRGRQRVRGRMPVTSCAMRGQLRSARGLPAATSVAGWQSLLRQHSRSASPWAYSRVGGCDARTTRCAVIRSRERQTRSRPRSQTALVSLRLHCRRCAVADRADAEGIASAVGDYYYCAS